MKKFISVILAVLLVAAAIIPASAAITAPYMRSQYPCIYIHGNAGDIEDEDGNVVYDFDPTTEQIVDICEEVLPKLAKGLLTGNFNDYYDSFEEQFTILYDKCSLDKAGNPKYGTDMSRASREGMEVNRHTNYENNGFGVGDYTFRCDWRLDPLYNAELLDDFIDDVLAVTGKDKVCLVSDCLGSVNILGYLGKCGHDKLYGIGLLDPVGFGCELIEDIFSGNVNLDPDAIERFVGDEFITTVLPSEYSTILEFVKTSVSLANTTGLLDGMSDVFMKGLYNRIKKELVPRLVRVSYGSWPAYWGLISAGRYAEIKEFVFGQPDSDKYNEYSGLIQKLDDYDTLVRQQIPELLTSAKDDGVQLAIFAKYGEQFPCVIESTDRQCDVWVSLSYATLGATCAPVGETLSDEYIAEREALGYGKYISPDRIVDMSTCLFPDNTWICKNLIHNQGGLDNDVLFAVLCGKDVTIDNSFAPQFTVYCKDTSSSEAMTEDNCHTESWYVEPTESKGFLADFFAGIKNFFAKIKLWFKQLFGLLKA